MDTDNVATVMGPTIVGYSSSDPTAIISESGQQKAIMKQLLSLSADYWSTFLAVEEENIFGLKVTPSNNLNSHGYIAGRMHTGNTPECPIFNPPMVSSTYQGANGRTPLTARPVARRTRSQASKQLSRDQIRLFQSPMLL